MKDARGAAKYIGRYLAHPAIVEYRIIKCDYNKMYYWLGSQDAFSNGESVMGYTAEELTRAY